MHREFPTKTSRIGGSAGCARSRESWNKLCQDGGGTTTAAKARRSSGGDDWKNRGEEEKNGDDFSVLKRGSEAQGSHAVAFSMPARSQGRPRRAWNAEEGPPAVTAARRHCSTNLQKCHPTKFPNYSQIFITTQKSPKTKVVQNQKFYNFAFETISKFGLHFEMNF